MKIQRVLIANRGEIALRIMHSLQAYGVECVNLYTKGEENLPHVIQSKNTICLGNPENFQDTYLNAAKIIQIAKEHNCQAIHPGYGFLSENAKFARLCEENKIVFIGPRAENIELMGDKVGSKRTMEKLGVPLIPGFHETGLENVDDNFLLQKAKEIHWPVLIKASAGGGGKGMRIVYDESTFLSDLSQARSEAKKSFNNDLVFLEKWLDHPRHIEAQIVSDEHGNHYFVGERECSIQRRYQKIIEESPCIHLSAKERKELEVLALKIAKHINYRGLGTLEFLYQDGEFYFLEMNTRIQVEHPISELVHGVDLVLLQYKIACGEKISLDAKTFLHSRGHALEVRLCAEIPELNFMPCSGDFIKIQVPQLPFNRFDYGYQSDNSLSVYFDPMLAKIIVYGMDRQDAILKMIYTLKNSTFLGTNTNKNFLIQVLNHKAFQQGLTFTHFIKTYEKEIIFEAEDETIALLIASTMMMSKKNIKKQETQTVWEKIPLTRQMV